MRLADSLLAQAKGEHVDGGGGGGGARHWSGSGSSSDGAAGLLKHAVAGLQAAADVVVLGAVLLADLASFEAEVRWRRNAVGRGDGAALAQALLGAQSLPHPVPVASLSQGAHALLVLFDGLPEPTSAGGGLASGEATAQGGELGSVAAQAELEALVDSDELSPVLSELAGDPSDPAGTPLSALLGSAGSLADPPADNQALSLANRAAVELDGGSGGPLASLRNLPGLGDGLLELAGGAAAASGGGAALVLLALLLELHVGLDDNVQLFLQLHHLLLGGLAARVVLAALGGGAGLADLDLCLSDGLLVGLPGALQGDPPLEPEDDLVGAGDLLLDLVDLPGAADDASVVLAPLELDRRLLQLQGEPLHAPLVAVDKALGGVHEASADGAELADVSLHSLDLAADLDALVARGLLEEDAQLLHLLPPAVDLARGLVLDLVALHQLGGLALEAVAASAAGLGGAVPADGLDSAQNAAQLAHSGVAHDGLFDVLDPAQDRAFAAAIRAGLQLLGDLLNALLVELLAVLALLSSDHFDLAGALGAAGSGGAALEDGSDSRLEHLAYGAGGEPLDDGDLGGLGLDQ